MKATIYYVKEGQYSPATDHGCPVVERKSMGCILKLTEGKMQETIYYVKDQYSLVCYCTLSLSDIWVT